MAQDYLSLYLAGTKLNKQAAKELEQKLSLDPSDRNMSTLLRQFFSEFSVFAFRTLGDFDPLRVPQKALRAFHYSGNAHRMGIS